MSKLAGKTAVVTGGNSGIGRAIAQLFAEQGANVVIFGRNQETLDEAAHTLGEQGLAVQGDVANLTDLDRLYAATADRFGPIDVLVVNAGVAKFAPLDLFSEDLFDHLSDINFKGAFFTVQKALGHLNDGASVQLVTSVANQKGMPGTSAYAATKAAVRALARSFSAELIGRGIRVNALSPGGVDTPIYGRLGLPQEALEELGASITQQTPIGRFAEAEELAQAALFLASADSSYVVGAELVVDGGFSQL